MDSATFISGMEMWQAGAETVSVASWLILGVVAALATILGLQGLPSARSK